MILIPFQGRRLLNTSLIPLASNLSSFFRSAWYFILPEAMPVIVFGISSTSFTLLKALSPLQVLVYGSEQLGYA